VLTSLPRHCASNFWLRYKAEAAADEASRATAQQWSAQGKNMQKAAARIKNDGKPLESEQLSPRSTISVGLFEARKCALPGQHEPATQKMMELWTHREG
jgi:hypothetical protein